MDKKFIKKEHLDEAVKRFQQIAKYQSPKQSLKKLYEYTFITAPQVNEDGNDDEQDGDNGNKQMSQTPQNVQNQVPETLNQQDGMNGQQSQERQPDQTRMRQNGNQQAVQSQDGNTQVEEPDMSDLNEPEVDDENNIETQEMDGNDEVVDVDDLTQSQEATEYKIDGVDDRLAKIYAVVNKFSDQLDRNVEEIMALKDEFEKRNPTEEEKLNIRSQSSCPYSETPRDYWENKAKTNPNYDVMFNNNVSPSDEQKEFKIKKSDVSGLNMKDISDSLNLKQNLNDYIGF